MTDWREALGAIDIYVLDQILRGRIALGMRVLDVGCGSGRNILPLLREGWDVAGVDRSPEAIAAIRQRASELARVRTPKSEPTDAPAHTHESGTADAASTTAGAFRVEAIEDLSFGDASADVVIACAVLHFARDEDHFDAMLDQLWRVLAPGGLLFTRLASDIGIEHDVRRLTGRWCALPDGSERFCVDAALLERATARLGGTLADPIKTTLVHAQRAMTTWVVRKGEA